MGYVTCQSVHRAENRHHPNTYWRSTKYLNDMIHTPEGYLQELKDIIQRYVLSYKCWHKWCGNAFQKEPLCACICDCDLLPYH